MTPSPTEVFPVAGHALVVAVVLGLIALFVPSVVLILHLVPSIPSYLFSEIHFRQPYELTLLVLLLLLDPVCH